MSSCYSTLYLIKTDSTLTFDQVDDYTLVDMVAYQQLVGKLMYLTYTMRPNISLIIEQLSCHNFYS